MNLTLVLFEDRLCAANAIPLAHFAIKAERAGFLIRGPLIAVWAAPRLLSELRANLMALPLVHRSAADRLCDDPSNNPVYH